MDSCSYSSELYLVLGSSPLLSPPCLCFDPSPNQGSSFAVDSCSYSSVALSSEGPALSSELYLVLGSSPLLGPPCPCFDPFSNQGSSLAVDSCSYSSVALPSEGPNLHSVLSYLPSAPVPSGICEGFVCHLFEGSCSYYDGSLMSSCLFLGLS